MGTEAQITANRRNSQKSTGPKTDEGKAASSQNAVKHGFFAHEALVRGESQTDFDLHREAFLAEYRPVGATESMLAERIVSLSWRLQRAERMESQAIDDLIIYAADSDGITRSLLEPDTRQALADSGTLDRDLRLGRAVVKDFARYRVLDRLMLYERRMENSIHKTIGLLKKLQLMRAIEQGDAVAQPSAAKAQPAHNLGSDLRKRSQFDPALMGTRAYAAQGYGGNSSSGPCENKPKPQQLEEPTQKGAGEKSGTKRAVYPIAG